MVYGENFCLPSIFPAEQQLRLCPCYDSFVSACSSSFGHKFFHEFHLNLLNLQEPLPLVDNQVVNLLVQMADLEFGFEIYPILMFGAQAIFGLLPVLTHHNDWSLYGRKAREYQVEKDEWIGIEWAPDKGNGVRNYPKEHNGGEAEDEIPASTELGHPVRHALAEGQLFFEIGVYVPGK